MKKLSHQVAFLKQVRVLSSYLVLMTANDICKLIKRKFDLPKHIALFEVRNTTGFSHKERYADAMTMALWPSLGCKLSGYEIKVSQSDLKHELMHLEKSEVIKQYCDHWWLVISSLDVLCALPIPTDWGLMCCYNDDLKIIKNAPELTAKPLPRGLLASMLRNAWRSRENN